MNVLAILKYLEEAQAVYAELKDSGLLEEIGAALDADKRILEKIQGNGKLQSFFSEVEKFLEHR